MKKIITCKKCGEKKPHNAFGLCANCYQKQNLKVCVECGELKPHKAFGLCISCYENKNKKICKGCGQLKQIVFEGLCRNCYNHKIGKYQSMSKNKLCSFYLGKYVKNEFLPKYFKNIEHVDFGDYNFICDNDKKIKVIASSHRINKKLINSLGFWQFTIYKNKIPDYFLCIAFDNRKELNIQHIWLIPAREINHLKTFGISVSKTDKWKIYEKDLNKAIKCCDVVKDEKKKGM